VSDLLRTLNGSGINVFRQYLQSLRDGSVVAPPSYLLTDPAYSDEFAPDVPLQLQSFKDSYEFGSYLAVALGKLDRSQIAYDYSLWSWLALYFFDQVCPVENGTRAVLEDAVYILSETFNHRRYYRHLVRTPWEAVARNGDCAKVLLQTRAGGKRSDIFEQLAARQTIFGNRTIIAGAYQLYYDVSAQLPKRGAGGKGAGSPRRLVSFIQQIDLTYDLQACTPQQFIDLLPGEFAKFNVSNNVA